MTRLFFRFYVGVILILFAAWYVQAWVSRYNVDEQNARVVVKAMAGAVRVSRDWLNTDPGDQDEILGQIRKRFEFPVNIYEAGDAHFPGHAKRGLQKYERIVLYNSNDGSGDLHVATRLAARGRIVSLGPLPELVGPEQTAQLTGLGIILVLAAAAIAVLLRPVARQLREVERTATAIADGDLSARIEAQRVPSSRSLALAFNSMADRTQSMLRTQRELLQAVSHDLRTPLARIRFAIDLVGSAKDDDERENRLQSIDHAAEDLDRLVGELLNYVRMETDDLTANVASLPANELLVSLVDYRREMHPDLKFEVDVPVDLFVQADEAGLHRVAANLIGNACRYAKKSIRISSLKSDDSVTLRFEDDGPGIPPEDRERVLNPFVRLAESGQDSDATEKGVGLGLALVARIVERHGGDVRISDSSSLGGCLVETNWPAVDN